MGNHSQNQGMPAKRQGVQQDDATQGQLAERDRAAVTQQQAADKQSDLDVTQRVRSEDLEAEPADDDGPASKR